MIYAFRVKAAEEPSSVNANRYRRQGGLSDLLAWQGTTYRLR